MTAVGAEELKRAMTHFGSGVTVVSTNYDGLAHAMTATAFCSVSLEPPMVLVCVARHTRFHPAVLATKQWAVSILSAEQAPAARHLSTSGRDLATQLDQFPHRPAPVSGAPILNGSLAWLDCVTSATHEAGDHTIIVGTVLQAGEESANATPLAYYRGVYSDALT